MHSELKDTENRIERAFHQQTQYMLQQFTSIRDHLDKKIDSQNDRMDSQTRWMVGLILTMTIAIILAVLFK
ncbi:MAG: hypothetical protein ACPGRX_05620 [Bdellovibrionales bacterium]